MTTQMPSSGSLNQRPMRSEPSGEGAEREGEGGGGGGGGGGGLPVEEGVREVGDCVGDTEGGGLGNEDAVAAIVRQGGADVKGAGSVGGPRGACVGGFEGVAELAHGEDGVGVEIEGLAVEAVMGGYGGVGAPGEKVVKGKLDCGEKLVPKVERKGDMGSGKGGDDVVFRRPDRALGKVGAVVVWGHVVNGGGGGAGAEEGAEIGRGFVVCKEVGDGMAGVGEEAKDGAKGVDIGGGSFGGLGGQAGVAAKGGDEYVLIALAGFEGKPAGEVGGRPEGTVDGRASGS